MHDLLKYSADGKLLEAMCVGTAIVVGPVGRIGYQGKDIQLTEHEGGLGPIANALSQRLVAIQEGRFGWKGWSVTCE